MVKDGVWDLNMQKQLHALAKQYEFNSQDLVLALQKAGFDDIKNSLSPVSEAVAQWLDREVASGWSPPSTENRPLKKKKVAPPRVAFKAAVPVRPGPSRSGRVLPGPAADPSASEPAEVAPTDTPSDAPTDTPVDEPMAVAVAEPEAIPETIPAVMPEVPPAPVTGEAAVSFVPAENAEKAAEVQPERTEPSAPEVVTPPPAPKVVKPAPVPVNRPSATKISGSAAVGMASPETLAAIRRAQQDEAARQARPRPEGRDGGRGGDRRGAPGGAGRSSEGPSRSSGGSGGMVTSRFVGSSPSSRPVSRPAAGPGGRGGPAAAAGSIPGALPGDDAGRGRVKQRIKPVSRTRGETEDAELAAERRRQAAKRGRVEESAGWIVDDDIYDGLEDDDGLVPHSGDEEAGADGVDTNLLLQDENDQKAAGFKHRRADFRSKKLATELPASFAELDGELTRSLTGGGGGRRRVTRGAGRRSPRGGRRGRVSRRPVVARVEGQPAEVFLGMTVRDLSVAMGVKLPEILGYLMRSGQMLTVNDILPAEDIELVAAEFKTPLEWRKEEDLEDEVAREMERAELSADAEDICERPPVVTFMGHVDHGKTSLLDHIRSTRVAAGEHGGITQHIGAYSVETRSGRRITFLDTPGHEAFSAMRARGAQLTDIVVLVVAADDGVMPQTIEAANHAKSAGVPVVVAINKCDMRSANPDRVKQELSTRLELLPEEWGGQIGMVCVSAITGMGMDDLLERILLESEMLELKANPERLALGYVVEAQMTEGQGVVATILVKDGTLHRGDVMLCSNGYGRARLMTDEYGRPAQEAGPGRPVRVSGLSAVPDAGDQMVVVADAALARQLAEQREREARQRALARRAHVTLENLTQHLAGSNTRELGLVVKADVAGSLEVLEKTLVDLSTSEVRINIIHSGVGGINQADVILADASDALVVGFHVVADPMARTQATSLGVQIKVYHVIYRLMEDMKVALEGLLPPEEKEVVQGHIEVRKVFSAKKVGNIAGCYVTDGFVTRQSRLRVIRDNIVCYEGRVGTLKRFTDDVREVKGGFECGMTVDGYNDIRTGDILQAYSVEEVARKL